MTQRQVTEFDLRAEEFKHPDTKPEDYEFRADGKIVRKDRWERGIRAIVSALGLTRSEWEIEDVVRRVEVLIDNQPRDPNADLSPSDRHAMNRGL